DGASVAIKQMVGLATKQAIILSFSYVFLILTALFLAMILGVAMTKENTEPKEKFRLAKAFRSTTGKSTVKAR
ncbi:hypothetical protein ACC735_39140, partial [Rhizobium ruizarguesonis]